MLDFMMVSTRTGRNKIIEIYPKFKVSSRSTDLMIRGSDFYAIWVEDRKLWSTSEDDAIQLIDHELDVFAKEFKSHSNEAVRVMYMWDSESGMIDAWHKYCQKQCRDNYHMLDEKLIFSNMETTKKDYASKKLEYPLEQGDKSAYEKLISTLYSPEEREKIEWAIGSVVAGESSNIQKFLVFYGGPGTGKSTVLNIIQKLFDGYYSVFDAKALGSPTNVFALEAFRSNPLVGIQHDGDLSRIEDNTRLNSLVSHELMTVNEKFKSTYTNKFNTFLFMGTNKPVKITDAKSGLMRRLIDVSPTGAKLSYNDYVKLTKRVNFELGAIAEHCLNVYKADPSRYDNYMPLSMMDASNDMFNFVLDNYLTFKRQNATTLSEAWATYKAYCDDARVSYPLTLRAFKEELKNYFNEFFTRHEASDGERYRNYYEGFKADKFSSETEEVKVPEIKNWLSFKETDSILDRYYADCPAQYANDNGTPTTTWAKCKTKLKDIDTHKLHYLKLPDNTEKESHIFIDFDIPDKDGNKCLDKNIEAASAFPPTYAELSKSGQGIHLHYIYPGDASKLSRIYDEHIEIKVQVGSSSSRRQLSKCNGLNIATISSNLPLKGESKTMFNEKAIKSEKQLRIMIARNLNKEFMGATKPSMEFIKKLLDDAYESGLSYDISDMTASIFAFACGSTHQSDYCIKLMDKMHFMSDDKEKEDDDGEELPDNGNFVFFDVEVFPNLFLVNWKADGSDSITRMINPNLNPIELEPLIKKKLIGFNNRRYDNHILYAAYMGYTCEQLFDLSQQIIGSKTGFIREAYNISYTDIYDFAATKQSLKKWEIELGIHHQELGLPWDKPVPEEMWSTVAEYCDNDVIATEALFYHLKGDYDARLILAELAGSTPNDTTNGLTTKIIFGNDRHPELVYTNLEDEFPGYEFVKGEDNKLHNMYRGVDLGFGGYVYSEPGMYTDVALLDVKSLHPHSAIALNAFGKYTKTFKDLVDLRVAIKEKRFDDARVLFNGKVSKYLDDPETAKRLAYALKIAINSVYGLTSASFDNPFRDPRNRNNIIALRGALFMKTLQDEVAKRGFTVAHIKTDSIKIPNATPEIIDFCMEFAKKYGYEFDHEADYSRLCLVNNAVYVAKDKKDGHWTATGTQFQVPYVFKSLFSKEPLEFKDFCETKSVETALYLDFNENLPDGEHDYQFVGKVGSFTPVKSGKNGGLLLRETKTKYDSAVGAKGFRWMESEKLRKLDNPMDYIDISYYKRLADDAVIDISQYGDMEWFCSDD